MIDELESHPSLVEGTVNHQRQIYKLKTEIFWC